MNSLFLTNFTNFSKKVQSWIFAFAYEKVGINRYIQQNLLQSGRIFQDIAAMDV